MKKDPEHSDAKDETASSTGHMAKAAESGAQVAEELKAATVTKAQEILHSANRAVEDTAQKLWGEVQDSPVWKDTARAIQEHPLKSMLIVFGIGYVFGMARRH